jgi:8-oxo-dGTP diphosphatase
MAIPVDVAVAVLVRGDGQVLLAQRPVGKVYSGYWEFPGGKVEPGESAHDALVREIDEELGIEITHADPWITQVFTYPHATVRLHFFRATKWVGEPHAKEHQGLTWQHPGSISVTPMLPANGPVLKGLLLPDEYAITCASSMGVDSFMPILDRRLADGLRLIQVREPGLERDELRIVAEQVIARTRNAGGIVLINSDIALAHMLGADGVHLNSRQLMGMTNRPDVQWCAASCHSMEELRAAEALGVDFVVLGPVLQTASHPEANPIGWGGFERMIREASLPVYALGGLHRDQVAEARSHGAHGIAMLRGSWNLS